MAIAKDVKVGKRGEGNFFPSWQSSMQLNGKFEKTKMWATDVHTGRCVPFIIVKDKVGHYQEMAMEWTEDIGGGCARNNSLSLVDDAAAEINGKEVSIFPVKVMGAGFAVSWIQ